MAREAGGGGEMICIKCGGNMLGPTYRNETYGECLLYKCSTCGYESREMTNDAKNQKYMSTFEYHVQTVAQKLKKESKAK
jgi:DNA-directed RNA polymerase subunit M/transcription elongation factor TFIIS